MIRRFFAGVGKSHISKKMVDKGYTVFCTPYKWVVRQIWRRCRSNRQVFWNKFWWCWHSTIWLSESVKLYLKNLFHRLERLVCWSLFVCNRWYQTSKASSGTDKYQDYEKDADAMIGNMFGHHIYIYLKVYKRLNAEEGEQKLNNIKNSLSLPFCFL